jgi:hypothetical protein
MPSVTVTTYGDGMHRLRARDTPSVEHPAYVRGGFGGEMDRACDLVAGHFLALPEWPQDRTNPHEIVYLTGFLAFIALASSPSVRLGAAEAATGARASVARRLMTHGTKAEALTAQIKSFHARLNEYSTLWVGTLKGVNSFGAFSLRAFENVQVGDTTRQGYLEHLNAFPDVCDRRIKAFHASSAATWVV